MAAWGETSEEEEDSQEEEIVEALITRSESKSDLESIESLSQLKDKVRGLSTAKVVKLLFSVMNECETIQQKHLSVWVPLLRGLGRSSCRQPYPYWHSYPSVSYTHLTLPTKRIV